MFLLWHPWLTTTNLSYSFPLLETSATALCGTTGISLMFLYLYTYFFCKDDQAPFCTMPQQWLLLRKSEEMLPLYCTQNWSKLTYTCIVWSSKKMQFTVIIPILYSSTYPSPLAPPPSPSLSSCVICRSAAGRELGCSWQDPHPLAASFQKSPLLPVDSVDVQNMSKLHKKTLYYIL